MNTASSSGFELDALPVLSTHACGFLCQDGIGTALGLRFPDTHPSIQELRAVGFSHQLAFQKEIDDRNVSAIKINVNFPTPQPVQQPWTRVAVAQEGEFPVADRIASGGWIFPIDCFHEQELQVILRPHPTRDACCSDSFSPQSHPLRTPKFVPLLHIPIDDGLDEE